MQRVCISYTSAVCTRTERIRTVYTHTAGHTHSYVPARCSHTVPIHHCTHIRGDIRTRMFQPGAHIRYPYITVYAYGATYTLACSSRVLTYGTRTSLYTHTGRHTYSYVPTKCSHTVHIHLCMHLRSDIQTRMLWLSAHIRYLYITVHIYGVTYKLVCSSRELTYGTHTSLCTHTGRHTNPYVKSCLESTCIARGDFHVELYLL